MQFTHQNVVWVKCEIHVSIDFGHFCWSVQHNPIVLDFHEIKLESFMSEFCGYIFQLESLMGEIIYRSHSDKRLKHKHYLQNASNYIIAMYQQKPSGGCVFTAC